MGPLKLRGVMSWAKHWASLLVTLSHPSRSHRSHNVSHGCCLGHQFFTQLSLESLPPNLQRPYELASHSGPWTPIGTYKVPICRSLLLQLHVITCFGPLNMSTLSKNVGHLGCIFPNMGTENTVMDSSHLMGVILSVVCLSFEAS